MAAELQDSVFNWPLIIGASISAVAAIGSVIYNNWRTGQYRKEDTEARERDRQDSAYLRAEKQAQERMLISVKLIERMEAFAAGCADVAQDSGEPCGEYSEYESTEVIPELSFEGMESDWQSLPGPLLFRIQDMVPSLRFAKSAFSQAREYAHDDPPITVNILKPFSCYMPLTAYGPLASADGCARLMTFPPLAWVMGAGAFRNG